MPENFQIPRQFQNSLPENFLEVRRIFDFGENFEAKSGLDFLEKSEMGEKIEAEASIDVQSKLGFLKQKISITQQEKIKNLENTSEIFQTLFEMPEGVENYSIRKETFEKNRSEILEFAKKSFSAFDIKTLQDTPHFSGSEFQNIALKRWLKSRIFNPENYLLESKDREKNNVSEKYDEAYFSDTENYLSQENLGTMGDFNDYDVVSPEEESGGEHSEQGNNARYKNAINELYKNMSEKGEKPRKDSLIIISDIKNNQMIVRQKGQQDWVIPAVFGKSIGNIPGSRATPKGSFKLKTRSIVGEGNPASATPNITGAAISMYGLESANRNSFGRGILIHGMPGVSQSDIVSRANTHGCTGLTDADAIKLAKRITSAPSAYMQQIT